MQLESNVEFKEFLEVHKPRANKSTWSNDIVLSSSVELPKDENVDVVTSKAIAKHDSPPETVENKPENTKKLSDLEVSNKHSIIVGSARQPLGAVLNKFLFLTDQKSQKGMWSGTVLQGIESLLVDYKIKNNIVCFGYFGTDKCEGSCS